MIGMYTHGQRFTMNLLTKFYALTLSLAATVVATTPANAANLGLFEINGSGYTSTGAEQQIKGTFTQDFKNFDILVTQVFSTYPSPLFYGDETAGGVKGFDTDGNVRLSLTTRPNPASKLVLGSTGTLKEDINGLEIGQSLSGSWQQYDTSPAYSTAGLGSVTVTAVPEGNASSGMVLSGAMLMGGIWAKRRKQ